VNWDEVQACSICTKDDFFTKRKKFNFSAIQNLGKNANFDERLTRKTCKND